MPLQHLRMTAKLMLIVGVMGVGEAVVSVQSIVAIEELKERTDEVSRYEKIAIDATRLSLDLAEAGRAELVLLAVASPEAVARQEQVIATQSAEALARVRLLEGQVRPDGQGQLRDVTTKAQAYLERIKLTLAAARRAAAGQGTATEIAESATANRPSYLAATEALDQFRASVIAAADRIDAESRTQAASAVGWTIGVAAGGILLSLLLGWWIATRAVSRPLGESLARLKGLANDDLASPVPGDGRKDEIGDLAQTMRMFRDKLTETKALQAREAEQQATRVRRAEKLTGLTSRFEGDARSVVATVASASTELERTAASMTQAVETTLERTKTVDHAGRQAASNVQTVAAATEQLSASVAEISRQVTESARVSQEAVADAARSDTIVKGLSEAASRIGDVVRLINDIASQTNLLALNATIEAARAGEAGKGFAVVAAEVKNLATQTAKATDEIGGQISAMQGATDQAVAAIGSIGETIGRISEISSAIAAAVEEQGAATREIARNVQDAATGTNEVASHIGGIADASQTTGASAGQVLSASRELSRQAETMRGLVDHFLTDVKAA